MQGPNIAHITDSKKSLLEFRLIIYILVDFRTVVIALRVVAHCHSIFDAGIFQTWILQSSMCLELRCISIQAYY